MSWGMLCSICREPLVGTSQARSTTLLPVRLPSKLLGLPNPALYHARVLAHGGIPYRSIGPSQLPLGVGPLHMFLRRLPLVLFPSQPLRYPLHCRLEVGAHLRYQLPAS